MIKIITRSEAILQGLSKYFTGKPCKNGHLSYKQVSNYSCEMCTIEWKKNNATRIKGYEKIRIRDKNKVAKYSKEWTAKNREHVNELHKIWRNNNLEKSKGYQRKYRKTHAKSLLAKCRNEQLAKLNATPRWSDLEKIKKIYINCPKGYHVDHIYPIQSEVVCGLHVSWNLQYLTSEENLRKGNSVIQGL